MSYNLTFTEYQTQAKATAKYPKVAVLGADGLALQGSASYIYPTLGLAGEAGEVAEKIKKIVRDKRGQPVNTDREAILKELGDVLWYISQIATEFGFSLEDVAQTNLDKLASRARRGKIQGSGDDR